MPEYRDAGVIALYAASPVELPTRQLFERAHHEGRRCAFPVVRRGRRLEFAIVSCWENLHGGRYGLLEPQDGSEIISIVDSDLVLVPGLAFDLHGGRLGQGGGYYDRALTGLRSVQAHVPVFGMAHDWQVVESVPRGERDVLMDGVVTELRVVRVERGGGTGVTRESSER